MKVYSLSGRSGTGKSFQAINLCKEKNIESIIDDGLFIYRNKVISGISAKRQRTIIQAVKTAIFSDDDKAEEAKAAIARMNPESLLVIGTSDEMIDRIVARLELPEPSERIYIEDITTEEERVIARKQRKEMGQHVIPAPTFQLRKQFSGYFMKPMRIIREFGPKGQYWKETAEKSVVRPSYSYMGKYNISEKVMSDIIDCIGADMGCIHQADKVLIKEKREMSNEGIELEIVVDMDYGEDLMGKAETFQTRVANEIEEMTAFNVNKVDVEVKDII
ncbi:MAG: Asp23/Gls24 family envelope stress response protein [Clostridiales bacterium]|nr:Asp23/Gls24 family envelope stress response protein [Clostridiales bacterium]